MHALCQSSMSVVILLVPSTSPVYEPLLAVLYLETLDDLTTPFSQGVVEVVEALYTGDLEL